MVGTFKAITSKIIFEVFPQVKKKRWGGHLWMAGSSAKDDRWYGFGFESVSP